MMHHKRLEHRFVKHLPDRLEPGLLYVSMDYATASHSCCGCGKEVVTPFTPTDWKVTFDGEAISLNPSVGNWNLPCRSHYVIEGGRVIEAGPWINEEVQAERKRDRAAKARFYGQHVRQDRTEIVTGGRGDFGPSIRSAARWLARLFRR